MRPHVEKTGAHGLFTDSDVPINLSAVAKEVAGHPGVVFTEVLSLRREDAARLGYDHGSAWRDLLRSHTKEMAEAMKIPLPDLRWYAAFHNESHHPHMHIVAYSAGKEPYMTEQGLHRLKSSFAREIFKQDLLQIYDRQTEHRNALAQESRDMLSEIVEQINTGGYDNETVELMLKELSDTLSRTKGKKVYGYLPQRAKNLVNGIVDELAKDSRIAGLYDLWYEQREKVIRTYTDTMPERIPLSQNKEFKSVRNAVIQEAMNLLQDRLTFEDALDETDEPAPEMSDAETEPTVFPFEKRRSDVWKYYFKAKDCLDRNSEQYDPAEGVRLLTLVANQGLDIAAYRLGKLFLCGEDIEKDVGTALHWLWQAAEQENQYAQYQLGKMYLYGQEVEQDYQTAIRLLTASADQGNPYARYVLEHYQPGAGRAPVGLAALRLIARLSEIIRNDLRREENVRQHIEKKLRQKIVWKMELHGQKMG